MSTSPLRLHAPDGSVLPVPCSAEAITALPSDDSNKANSSSEQPPRLHRWLTLGRGAQGVPQTERLSEQQDEDVESSVLTVLLVLLRAPDSIAALLLLCCCCAV